MLRRVIWWLDALLLAVLGASIAVAISGQYTQDHAAGHEWEWPGLAQQLLLYALLLIAFILFGTILAVWLMAALRLAERGWAVAALAVIVTSIALGITAYTHSQVIFGMVGDLLRDRFFVATLLVFVPLLVGVTPATIYSVQRDSRGH